MILSASYFYPYIRDLLKDNDSERFSDTQLLMYVQDALFRLSLLRPDVFSTYIDHEVEYENVLQKLPDNVQAIIDIHATNGKFALKETSKRQMDEMARNWISEKSSQPVQWMRDKRARNSFFLYPTPVAGTRLTIQCVYIPILKTKDQEFDFNIQYQPVLVDKVVAIAESMEDEAVDQNKSNMFDALVASQLKADIEANAIKEEKN